MTSGTPEIMYRRIRQTFAPPEGQDRPLIDRRINPDVGPPDGIERRQFVTPSEGLSAEGQELAAAIDDYKFGNRLERISVDELLQIVKSLGYHK